MYMIRNLVNFETEYSWFKLRAFPSPKPVAILRIENQFCSTNSKKKTWINVFTKEIGVKGNVNKLIPNLNLTTISSFMMIIVKIHANNVF